MLVSYADSSAVHPGAMTAWRMEQLWRLYVETYNELTRELDVERIDAAEDATGASSFQAGFPTRYQRTQPPEAVSLHGALHELAATRGVAVDLKKRDGVWHLVVAAHDRAGLFASLCGAISGFGLNILKAEAFANRRGMVLDMFAFSDPNRNLDLNPPEVERFRVMLERAVLGNGSSAGPSRNCPAAARASPAWCRSTSAHPKPPLSSRSSPRIVPACCTTLPRPSRRPAAASTSSWWTPKRTKPWTCSTSLRMGASWTMGRPPRCGPSCSKSYKKIAQPDPRHF
jgi:hypothetical protein